MAQSQELEAASRSSETYLAENGGGRPASVQPRSCFRVQEGTGQNYLVRTSGNGYVTDKPRMMMTMMMCCDGLDEVNEISLFLSCSTDSV